MNRELLQLVGVAIAGAKTLKLVPMDGKVIDWVVAA